MQDLLADGRCSRAVLGFLSTTDVGRRVPGVEEDDAVSAVSELEVREWKLGRSRERERERRRQALGEPHCSYPRRTSRRPQERRRFPSRFPL